VNLDRYMDLFVHRRDVFAEQSSAGHYRPVGKGHFEDDPVDGGRRFVYDLYYPITEDDVAEHLGGFVSYGAYVIAPDSTVGHPEEGGVKWEPQKNTVKFVVFDLDTYDEAALEHLKWCVHELLNDLGEATFNDTGKVIDLRCLLLESSGGKGFHVWLFLSAPLPATQVRRWLGWAFWPLWLEAAADAPDWPALEVFPKQDSVDEGGFGNLVKLPFGVHAKTGNRSEVVPVTDWANAVDEVMPLDSSMVPAVTQDEEPAALTLVKDDSPRGRTPFPCIDRILSGDVIPGTRDDAMFHLALFYFGQGLDRELVLEACRRVNATFPKPLRDNEVVTKVRSAFSGRHRAGCSPAWLRDFCPGRSGGGCPKWALNPAPPGGALHRVKEGDTIQVEVVAVAASHGRKRVTVTHPDADNQPTLVVG
jgi:hypothetical protein